MCAGFIPHSRYKFRSNNSNCKELNKDHLDGKGMYPFDAGVIQLSIVLDE
jgi:hypothetical protein